MRRLISVSILLSLTAAACSTPEPVATTADPVPTTTSSTTTTLALPSASDFDAGFMAYLYPVDGEEYVEGFEAITALLYRSDLDSVGQCIGSAGYPDVEAQFKVDSILLDDYSGVYPHLGLLRMIGFEQPTFNSHYTVRVATFAPPVVDEESHMVYELEDNQSYGITPTIENAIALQHDLAACLDTDPDSSERRRAGRIQTIWDTEAEYDEFGGDAPELLSTTLACLNDVQPVVDAADSVLGWFENKDIADYDLWINEEVSYDAYLVALAEWGTGYARCVEELDAVRRVLLVEKRDAEVRDNFDLLMEMQDALLDEVEEAKQSATDYGSRLGS